MELKGRKDGSENLVNFYRAAKMMRFLALPFFMALSLGAILAVTLMFLGAGLLASCNKGAIFLGNLLGARQQEK